MPKLLPDEVRSFLEEPGHLIRLATFAAVVDEEVRDLVALRHALRA